MMEKRLVAIAAAVGGLVIGVAGASLFMHAQAAPVNSSCPTYDAKVDTSIDAAVKLLHAHDHDQYVPHPARSPFGDAPKLSNAEPAKDPSQ
jgi:hypothetical protein